MQDFFNSIIALSTIGRQKQPLADHCCHSFRTSSLSSKPGRLNMRFRISTSVVPPSKIQTWPQLFISSEIWIFIVTRGCFWCKRVFFCQFSADIFSVGHGRYIKQCISQQATGEAINWGKAAAGYVLYGRDMVEESNLKHGWILLTWLWVGS